MTVTVLLGGPSGRGTKCECPRYCPRKARSGPTLVARRAGTYPASSATSSNRTAAPVNATASVGFTGIELTQRLANGARDSALLLGARGSHDDRHGSSGAERLLVDADEDLRGNRTDKRSMMNVVHDADDCEHRIDPIHPEVLEQDANRVGVRQVLADWN